MRITNAFSWILSTVLIVVSHTAPSSTSAAPTYAPLVAGNTEFALNLYGQIAAQSTDNIFFSPYSISTCLGLVYEGARGETASQMAQTLHLNSDPAQVGSEFGALQAELNAQQGVNGISLSVANGLWAQLNFPFLPAFLDDADTNYDATVQQVDFTTAAPQITAEINDWVSSQTDGMIPDLLKPGILNASTRLALVNAIYFRGGWQTIFATNLTTAAPFYVSPNQFVNAFMMEQLETARYYEDSWLQAVELPYLNSNITMVVLLPKVNGPAVLTSQELTAALNGLTPKWMDVRLPKFKLDATLDLVTTLKNMGMVNAFLPGVADFSGIDGSTDLSIGNVLHKAVVDVNETGTVAAGATVVTVISTVVMVPTVFQADHPFFFLIRDTNSASILFMGRVADPTAGGTRFSGSPPGMIQTADSSFGLKNHQFGFKVAASNPMLVVETCTNIASGVWLPVQTLTLTNGSAYFSEPQPANGSSRFYRVRPPTVFELLR